MMEDAKMEPPSSLSTQGGMSAWHHNSTAYLIGGQLEYAVLDWDLLTWPRGNNYVYLAKL